MWNSYSFPYYNVIHDTKLKLHNNNNDDDVEYHEVAVDEQGTRITK